MSSVAQRQVLIGLQTVAGTGVNVDTALRAKASLKAMPDKVDVDEDIGSFAPARHYVGSLKAEGSLDFDGYYEHAPHIVAMAMGNTPPTYGGGLYTYANPLPDDTPTAHALYTMEYTDGEDHIVRAEDVFATALEISGEAGKSWMLKPSLVGAETTFPAAISATPDAPAPVSPILMADTTLAIDDLYANIGVTAVAELIQFTWKIEQLQHQKLFAGSLWPSGRGYNKWKVTLELIVEIEQAKVETEKDKLLSTAQSAVRVQAVNAAGYTARIDGMYYLKELDSLDDRDGNNTIKMLYQGEKSTLDDTGAVTVITDLTGL